MMMESTSSTRAFELEDYREKAAFEEASPRGTSSNHETDEADEAPVAHDEDSLKKEDLMPMSTIDLTEETQQYDGDDVEQASIVLSLDDVADDKQQTTKRRCRCTKKRCCICFIILIIIMLLLFAILMIGAHIEEKNFRRSESTLELYTQDESVCAMTNSSTDDSTIQSFESSEKALGNNATNDIVHCGECGECSNRQDLEILAATRSTLTKDATSCAYKMFLGRSHVDRCLEDKVGFTESCNDCWVDNIQCTFNYCKFTCVKFKMFGSKKNNDKDGDLNDCLHCDEVMCGSEFLECSGANRRRMGIVSDIGRDANREQCMDVTLDWAMLVPDPTDSKTSSGV